MLHINRHTCGRNANTRGDREYNGKAKQGKQRVEFVLKFLQLLREDCLEQSQARSFVESTSDIRARLSPGRTCQRARVIRLAPRTHSRRKRCGYFMIGYHHLPPVRWMMFVYYRFELHLVKWDTIRFAPVTLQSEHRNKVTREACTYNNLFFNVGSCFAVTKPFVRIKCGVIGRYVSRSNIFHLSHFLHIFWS